jgi:secreted trypsin-like serine protease
MVHLIWLLTLTTLTSQNVSASSKFDTQIIGGLPVKSGETISRSTVGLFDRASGSLCTGSLYSPTHVITAAHCVDMANSNQMVILFGLDLKDASVQKRSVVGYRAHLPAGGGSGDIALVKFEGGLPTGYEPATLLTNESALQNGGTVTLAGYGITDGAARTGSGLMRKVNSRIKEARWTPTEVLIDQTNGRGACHGDSGGPAFTNSGSKLLLFGVTSRGINDPKDDCSQFAAYTNILSYTQWLEQAVRDIDQNPNGGEQPGGGGNDDNEDGGSGGGPGCSFPICRGD